MTQDQLAERAGLAVDTVRRIERGALSPTLDSIAKLARGLETTLSGMFLYFDGRPRDEILTLSERLATCSPGEVRLVARLVNAVLERDAPRRP